MIWALIQIAAHPHTQSLYSIVKQEHIQKTALTKFPILKPDVLLIVPEAEDDDKPALSQVSVICMTSCFVRIYLLDRKLLYNIHAGLRLTLISY